MFARTHGILASHGDISIWTVMKALPMTDFIQVHRAHESNREPLKNLGREWITEGQI